MLDHRLEQTTAAEGQAAASRFCASTRHDAELEREVEVLSLGESMDDADSSACFARAAVALCALSHPGVPTLFSVSAEPPQLICGQLAGTTLRRVCQGLLAADRVTVGQYTLERLLVDVSRLCALLEDAHRDGFVHRNIRAESVVLGGFGDVYLKDWWYAQVPEHYFQDGRPGSQVEYMRGLPAFSAYLSGRENDRRPAWLDATQLAPELSSGWCVTPAADVWGAGQVLREVLDAWRAAAEVVSPSSLKADLALYEGGWRWRKGLATR